MAPRARSAAHVALLLVAGLAALALKRFYSGASAAELRFLLAPATSLVELLGGHRFDWTAEGYRSLEARFLIAPACAGVNFLLAVFAVLVLDLLRPWRSAAENAGLLAASAAAAFTAAVVANALRLLVTISLWTRGTSLGGLGEERLRELAGAMVFLGMLLALHRAARRLVRAPLHPWLPLLPYAGLTLLVPLLRGAGRRPEFWEHAAVVAGAIAAAGLAGAALHWRGSRRAGLSPPGGSRPGAAPR